SGKLLKTFTGHTKLINSVAVSPDSRWVLSGGDDGLRVWDLPPEVSDLVRALREGGDPAALKKAVEDLTVYGEGAAEAFPDLLRLLLVNNEDLRKTVLPVLAGLGKPRAEHIALLTPLLKPALPAEVRQFALEALTALGAEARPAAEALSELLKDESAAFRIGGAKALGAIGKAGRAVSYPVLLEALRDPDGTVSKA